MSQLFEYKTRIEERYLDTFGHVNNSVYLQLYEAARWDFMNCNGFGIKEIQDSQQGPVLLEVHLHFKRELLNRQMIHIHSQFQGMKNKKVMILAQEIVIAESGKQASNMEVILGFMDLKKRKLIAPSEQWYRVLGLTESEIKRLIGQA